jgi:hypothetical protein
MAKGNVTERAPGTTSLAEADQVRANEWQKKVQEERFQKIPLLYPAIEREYADMLKSLKGEDRMRTVRKLAEQKYDREQNSDTRPVALPKVMPPIPSRPAPAEEPIVEVEPIPDEELPPSERAQPLEIMDIVQWVKWDSVVYSPETLRSFMEVFVEKLTNALRAMSTDLQVRTFQLQQVQNLFMERVYRMYCNRDDIKAALKANAENSEALDSIRGNVQPWLDRQWEHALALAQKYK